MDQKTLVAGVIALTISIILTASVLVPVIQETQVTAGDKIVKTNPQNDSNVYMREIEDGDTLVITPVENSNVEYTLNGETILTIAGSDDMIYHSLIMSDVLNYYTGDAEYVGGYGSVNSTSIVYLNQSRQTTIEYDDGVFTLTSGSNEPITISGSEWGFIACNEDEAGYYESTRFGQTMPTYYVTGDNDIVLSGVYTTGNNDTFYSYYNGIASCAEDYDIEVTITKTLAQGTTDIYAASVSVDIGGEDFVPYRFMVPLEVEGHASSGAAYSLYGVIPLLVIVSIVLMAAGMIYSKRD